MSIIERTNPLNLQFRVCIVPSASSPLGVVVCKTLLKANALVLGVDSRPIDHSLNAGLGTHFQFLQCDLDAGSVDKIAASSCEKFGTDRVDVLVNISEGDVVEGTRKLSNVVGGLMGGEGKGSIINIASEEKVAKKAVGCSYTGVLTWS